MTAVASQAAIPVEEFPRRRAALAAALAAEGIDAWIAYGDDRQFAGADHVRYLTKLQPHFEGVVAVGTADTVWLMSGPETVGYAENAVAGAGIDRIFPIREMAHPGLMYRSIALADGATDRARGHRRGDAVRARRGDRKSVG
jgi:hypothetical protein